MKVKIEELVKISDEIDDIFHRHGFTVDHHMLALQVFGVIKSSYPQGSIELDKPDLAPLLEKYGQDIKDP